MTGRGRPFPLHKAAQDLSVRSWRSSDIHWSNILSKKFSGQIALVTGGAGGIGRASAIAFTAAGLKVAVVDCQHDGGETSVQMKGKKHLVAANKKPAWDGLFALKERGNPSAGGSVGKAEKGARLI